MFFLGHYKGAALLGRFPKLKKGVEAVGRRIREHEVSLILTFRFLYGLRNATPVFLGLNNTPLHLFIPLNLS